MWRDTGRTPRFLFMDARIVATILLWLLHMRMWTLYLFIASSIFFVVLERFGFTVPVALRALRVLIAGPIRKVRAIRWHRSGMWT